MPFKDLDKKKEYMRNYQVKWREKNKDKWKAIVKKSESRPQRKEYLKKWWKENPKAIEIKKRFKENHPDIHKEYCNRWRENNPELEKQKL